MIRIIKDTREIKGFNFDMYDVEVISRKLDEGDYALDNNKDYVIERKASVSEIYMNLATLSERKRFERECVRLQAYKHPIILLEFPESYMYDFPFNSGIPEDKWEKLRLHPDRLRGLFFEIPYRHPPISFVFCDNKAQAEEYVVNLFNEVKDGKKKFNF